jgi:hypothetical protein
VSLFGSRTLSIRRGPSICFHNPLISIHARLFQEVFSVTWPGKGTRLFFLAAESADAAGNMFGMETNVEELANLFKEGERKSLQGDNDYHRAVIFTNEFAVPLVSRPFDLQIIILYICSLVCCVLSFAVSGTLSGFATCKCFRNLSLTRSRRTWTTRSAMDGLWRGPQPRYALFFASFFFCSCLIILVLHG